MTTLKDIGKQIKERRNFLGMTAEDLSDYSNVSSVTISSIETGKGNPKINTIFKIIDALGLDVSLEPKAK